MSDSQWFRNQPSIGHRGEGPGYNLWSRPLDLKNKSAHHVNWPRGFDAAPALIEMGEL
jgi:hypothetical protein